MVLSNKKLKQKLRAAKAELIAASGAQNNFTDKDPANSLKDLLNQEDQRPKLSKREKRRQKAGEPNSEIFEKSEIDGDAVAKKDDELKSHDTEGKKKKRKRDETEASQTLKEKKPEQLKKKKKTKKKKKSKKKAGDSQVKEDGGEQNRSVASGEQLVAKADETTDRKDMEPSTKVYVGGIPYYSTEDDIRSYFEGCGTITAIDCMTFPDTGKFRGIAIITFKIETAAKRALALDGSDMGGLFLKIQPFKSTNKVSKQSKSNFSPEVLEGYNRIYIGNLAWDITEDDVRKLFSDCKITSIRFGEDKETGEFKGFGHVDFADTLSMKAALKLDQSIVCGRPIKISCAVPKKGTGAVTNLKSTPKDDVVENTRVPTVSEDQVTIGEVSSKIRRRTCYECGEKGHLSSACPKKQDDNVANPDAVPKEGGVTKLEPLQINDQVDTIKVDAVSEDKVGSSEVNPVSSSKIRRRTCYECGEKGHLSSACPKKQGDDVANPDAIPKVEGVSNLESMQIDHQVDTDEVNAVSEDKVNSSEVNVVSNSKIRRRTCYECGEKGHLSSSCPKKQADVANPGLVKT